jgi:Domain of unknown function (DUF4262)
MFNWFKKEKPASPAPKLPAAKDEYDRAILGDIARVGWSVIQIDPDDPKTESPYSFSVGLFHTHGHPEIILLGLPHAVAGKIINHIGGVIKLGKKIEPDRRYEEFTSIPTIFKKVDPRHYEAYVGYARWIYGGSNFPMLQCVWPLKSGLFPWDPGYPPEAAQIQPFLG